MKKIIKINGNKNEVVQQNVVYNDVVKCANTENRKRRCKLATISCYKSDFVEKGYNKIVLIVMAKIDRWMLTTKENNMEVKVQ